MKVNVDHPVYVLVFSAVVAAVFTGGIMAFHASTREVVNRNEKLFEQRALVEVFGLSEGQPLTDARIADLYAKHIKPLDVPLVDPESGTAFNVRGVEGPAVRRTYVATRDGGAVIGYAFPVWGVGFWAQISGYFALTPDLDRVIGIAFLEHSETPGLGGRIMEESWRERFDGLDVSPPPAGYQFIYIGGEPPAGPDSPKAGRYVDAITGATGTSAAVNIFLNERIPQFRRAAAAAGLGG